MPHDYPNPPLVTMKVCNRFLEIPEQASIGDLPNFDSAVLRSTGYKVIIVGAPLYVENCSLVAHNKRSIPVNSAGLIWYT